MSSASQQNFFSSPAFTLFRRGLTVLAVQRFRGMNQFTGRNQTGPDIALDCLNVIVSGSGGLEKMRLPQALSANLLFGSGPQSMWDFQYLAGGVTPTRQIVSMFQNSIYFFTWNAAGTALIANFLEALPTDNGPWDAVEANNILFLANNVRMLKWLGTGALENWGGLGPALAPAVGALIGQKAVVAAPNGVVINNNVVTVQTTTPHGLVAGDQFTLAGNGTTADGVLLTVLNVVDATHFQANFQTPNGTGGAGTETPQGRGALAFGDSWAYAYENSVTGHITNRSPGTVTTAAETGIRVITALPPPDPQFDTIQWYRTLDGGGNYFRILNPATATGDWPIAAGGLVLRDGFTDPQLDQATQATLINNPPPVGKYLVSYQGRIIIVNLLGAPQDFVWSGYEQILIGRPEESFPSNNRIHLSIGAESLAGVGAIQPGVVFYSSSGDLWMLRGALQDITNNAPVVWTDYLQDMPWTMGAYSHLTVKATPYGLIWLAGDKTVNIFDGTNAPTDISFAVYPYLRRITPGAEQQAIGAYFNFLERDWYALAIPIDGSITPNKVLFFALQSDKTTIDCFPTDIQADFITTVQTPQGQRQLLISQGGRIYKLPVASTTTSGVNEAPTSTGGILHAYWRGGYFGNDQPYLSKMWRQAALIADNQGFGAVLRFVDDRQRTFRSPETIIIPALDSEIIELNNRAHRVSIEIVFPDMDIDCAVLELQTGYIGTANRRS
jgi:hypothetical protein